MDEIEDTVGQWLDVADHASQGLDDDAWWPLRLQRQHGLQIALDVIGHAQYIPLRLMRRGNLARLDEVFVALVERWKPEVTSILSAHGPADAREAARKGIDALADPSHVKKLRDWVLSLASDKPDPRPASLPNCYEIWFLILLPHLEREVWLTDMSNGHPAHSLARMLEHWSLFVLMWAWKYEPSFGNVDGQGTEPIVTFKALTFDRMAIVVTHAFFRTGRSNPEKGHDVFLLGGPFELSSEHDVLQDSTSAVPGSDHWFYITFKRFVGNVYRYVPAWKDILDKAPSSTELLDAFATRPALTSTEATRRVKDAQQALTQLRTATLHPSVHLYPCGAPGRALSRANWESMAALASWFSRWKPRFLKKEFAGDAHIDIPGHRLSVLASWRSESDATSTLPQHVDVMFVDGTRCSPDIAARIQRAQGVSALVKTLKGKRLDLWLEMPAAFLARARERQHALWTSQAAAIGNLLARHSRQDRPVGLDSIGDERSVWRNQCEEADHLLRGYGGRVCQYLLQMTRAESATVLWLDYSATPPRLRHVGSSDRLIQHRAGRQSRFADFCEAASRAADDLLLYRCVSNASIEPPPADRRIDRQQMGDSRRFYKNYEEPKPRDAIAVPLLVHGRVVGAFSVSGMNSERQFDARLYTPLRLVAQHLAQPMALQSYLWQMRRLNWLASHRPIEEWRQHEMENQFNPLGKVAEVLANVFLCPAVHIWLQDPQNDARFKLHGYTRGDLFQLDGPLRSAPSFEVEDIAPNAKAPLNRHFAAFALDQWSRPNQHLWEDRAGRAGSFVQARYVGNGRNNAANSMNLPQALPAEEFLAYTLANAERGMLQLSEDFLNTPDAPDHRKAMYANGLLHQCMAFALVDASDATAKPVGVVSLYAPTSNGDSLQPWPTEWRPIVAHIQSYLPYVLMQTEAIANPLDQMRRYLLHEGRNELNHVVATTASLRNGLNALFAIDEPEGQFRPWLRKQLPLLNKLILGQDSNMAAEKAWLEDAQRELALLQKLLERNADLAKHLMGGEFSENLAVMARMIGNHRGLARFDPSTDPDFDHETEWFSPYEEIRAIFDSYGEVWRRDLHVQPDFSALPQGLEVLTSKRLWKLMMGDLVHNIAKYALPNEPIRIIWDRQSRSEQVPKSRALRISNFASYDKVLDREDRLGAWGKRGSAGLKPLRDVSMVRAAGVMREGQGIGLWGAMEVGKVLDIPVSLHVVPRERSESVANYIISLIIPRRLIRDHRP